MRIYTRKGDDGTTGLLYGGRVPKDSPRIELNGAVDEAQAALGLARAEAEPGSELEELLVALERDLYVLMAEVATAPANRRKLVAGTTMVTGDMVTALEARIDDLTGRFDMPAEFVVPGQNRRAAALDVARTVVRRAERLLATHGLGAAGPGPTAAAGAGGTGGKGDAAGGARAAEAGSGGAGRDDRGQPGGMVGAGGESQVGPYLNRLSDLVWAMARWQEGDEHVAARQGGRRGRVGGAAATGGYGPAGGVPKRARAVPKKGGGAVADGGEG